MKNTLAFMTLILISWVTAAQSKADDRFILDQTIEWLEDRLTYNYFNVEDDEWWINRFTFNDGSQTVTIKNIASPQLQAVTEKTYLQLNFKLENLNPYTIQVQKTEKNAGRLMKGSTIRVGAFDKSIHRSKNGKLSTDQSFIYFSIPEFFEDSVENYSQQIVDHLSKAILLSTRIYSGTNDENRKAVESVLKGRFIADNQYWEVRCPFPKVYEITVLEQDGEAASKHFVKVLSGGSQIEVAEFSRDRPTTLTTLTKSEGDKLIYRNEEVQWHFKNSNEIEITNGANSHSLIRDWTYMFDVPKYR